MKNSYNLLKIIASPILCFLAIYTTAVGIDYYPLIFGLVIGIVNVEEYKFGPFIGIVLSILASYITFFLAYFSIPLLLGIFKPIFGEDKGAFLVMLVSVFILAPLLVFIAYKFVFGYKKVKSISYIIICTIFLLVVVFSIHIWYYELTQFKYEFNELLNPYTLWQVIMALSIQLILYQHKFKKVKQ
jgi:hypothetical protein